MILIYESINARTAKTSLWLAETKADYTSRLTLTNLKPTNGRKTA
jgi:hypothetical protein